MDEDQVAILWSLAKEGAEWKEGDYPIVIHKENAHMYCFQCCLHAIKTTDGQIFDVTNGWRSQPQHTQQGVGNMDKNIAALLRSDAKTVQVRFFAQNKSDYMNEDPSLNLGKGKTPNLSSKLYTYVTDLPLAVGDLCLVYVYGYIPCVCQVESIDESVDIEPNSSIQYSWIAARIDLTNHFENIEKNSQITKLVAENYKKSTRSQFANMMLASMDENAQKQLASLIKTEGESNAQ